MNPKIIHLPSWSYDNSSDIEKSFQYENYLFVAERSTNFAIYSFEWVDNEKAILKLRFYDGDVIRIKEKNLLINNNHEKMKGLVLDLDRRGMQRTTPNEEFLGIFNSLRRRIGEKFEISKRYDVFNERYISSYEGKIYGRRVLSFVLDSGILEISKEDFHTTQTHYNSSEYFKTKISLRFKGSRMENTVFCLENEVSGIIKLLEQSLREMETSIMKESFSLGEGLFSFVGKIIRPRYVISTSFAFVYFFLGDTISAIEE